MRILNFEKIDNHLSKFLNIYKLMILISSIISIFLIYNDYLDKRIKNKINDPDFISKLSKSLYSYLIFDQNEIVIYEHNTSNLIKNLKVSKGKNHGNLLITVSFHQYLKISPLLECLGPESYLVKSTRLKEHSWKFDLEIIRGFGTNPINKFRMTIFK